VFPEFGPEWKSKIVLSGSPLVGDRMNFFKVVVRSPSGNLMEKRLPLDAYLQIVAATNFKQRTRKTLEYFHADRLNYAVVGTPNRLEYDQGFFVKNGDGAGDLKPIAHLYKTQVYALANALGLPEEILAAKPTTDTYSLEQGQDEFYFALPYGTMDVVLYGLNHGMPAARVAEESGLTAEQVERVFQDIRTKRRTTRPLHMKPVLMEPVTEVDVQ
jgi:NAD+ synthase